MGRIEIRCLGRPRVLVDGEPMSLGGKQAVTLALLVAAGPSGVAKATLYDQIFADDPQKSGESAAMMRVRRLAIDKVNPAAGAAVIDVVEPYRLDEALCTVDVWDFERILERRGEGWEHALRWWAEPYEGLDPLPDAVLISAERLRARYRSALARAGRTLAADDASGLVGRLSRELGEDPYNESLVAGAATALYRTGRQGEALQEIAAYRKRLLDSSGLDPGKQIAVLELAILDHEDTVAGPLAVEPLQLDRQTRRLVQPERFVGRVDLLASLRNELDGLLLSEEDHHSVQLISGPGGSGKTTLIRMLLAPLQADGVQIVFGSARTDGGLDGQIVAYRPFIEAFPDLESAAATASASGETEADQYEFWNEVHRTIQDLAESQPLIVVLEDLHDADSQTIGLMRHLTGLSLPRQVVLVVTTRPPAASTAWRTTYDALAAQGRVAMHTLEPLTSADIQQLVTLDHPAQDLVVRERFARALEDVSAGNPLVATAISRAATGDLDLVILPESVTPEEAYSQHVASLIDDRTLEQVLWVAALIGVEFESNTIASVLDLGQADVEGYLERAAVLHLCERLGLVTWRFDHLLTVAAISKRVDLVRPMLFAKLALAGSDNPLRMLRYVQGAGKGLATDERIERLTRCADSLRAQGAYAEAAMAWSALADLLPKSSPGRLDALIGAAGALSRVGRRHQAEEVRGQAVAQARSLDDGNGVFRSALAGLPSGEYAGGEQDRLDILTGMTDDERDQVSPVEFAKWSMRFARVCDDVETARAVEASIDETWEADVEQWTALHVETLSFQSQGHEPKRVLGELQELCEVCPDGEQRAELLHRAVLAALVEQRPVDEVRDAAARGAATARTHGTPRIRWSTDVLAATLAMVDFDDAPASPTTARNSGHRWGVPDVEDNFYVQTFMDLWINGAVGLAYAAINSVRDQLAMNVAWYGGLALSAAVSGEGSAAAEVSLLIEEIAKRPDGVWVPPAAALLAEAAYELSDPDAAEVAIEILRPWSGLAIVLGIGSAHFGPVDRYLGLATTVLGADQGPGLLEAAVEQADATGTMYWANRARLDLTAVAQTHS